MGGGVINPVAMNWARMECYKVQPAIIYLFFLFNMFGYARGKKTKTNKKKHPLPSILLGAVTGSLQIEPAKDNLAG